MDRMRAGLTGLGLVFVVTVAASAIVAGKPRQQMAEKSGEPLAQLGVAPGPEKDKGAMAAAALLTAPAPVSAPALEPLPEAGPAADMPAPAG